MNDKQIKVATIQFEPSLFAKEDNIKSLMNLVGKAAIGGARLIVTPEMGTTGYCWLDREEVAPYVETVPGATTDLFHALAAKHNCYIVVGMPEVDPATDLYYNTAVLIGPAGVIGRHRKTHSYISEPKWAAPGDLGHEVYETELGRIALLICMDIHFIETARLVKIGGAQIICHISNWLAERAPAPYWISRAVENGCYLIESNRWGMERTVQFSGASCVIAPDGEILVKIDTGNGIASCDISLSDSSAYPLAGNVADRRPALYKMLVSNPFTWNPTDFFNLYGMDPLPVGTQSHLAAMQFAPEDDVTRNLDTMEAMLESRSTSNRPTLVVFPEGAITGLSTPEMNAETIPGAASDRLVNIARRLGIHIVAGLAERTDEGCYNSAILVGPEGLLGTYRQIHVRKEDRTWAKAGSQWTTFDTPLGRIGLLLGYDAVFPESARLLALQGCDIVACPSAIKGTFTGSHLGSKVRQNYPIPTCADPYHWHHFRVRAGENNVYLAFANVHAPALEFHGQSGVFGPDTYAFPRKEAIVEDKCSTAFLEADTTSVHQKYPTNIVRRKDLMIMRLPHHYQPLVAETQKIAL